MPEVKLPTIEWLNWLEHEFGQRDPYQGEGIDLIASAREAIRLRTPAGVAATVLAMGSDDREAVAAALFAGLPTGDVGMTRAHGSALHTVQLLRLTAEREALKAERDALRAKSPEFMNEDELDSMFYKLNRLANDAHRDTGFKGPEDPLALRDHIAAKMRELASAESARDDLSAKLKATGELFDAALSDYNRELELRKSAESARDQAVEKLGEEVTKRQKAEEWIAEVHRMLGRGTHATPQMNADCAISGLADVLIASRENSEAECAATERAESAEQALRALREAVRETIDGLKYGLPVGSFDELEKALEE